MKIYNKYKWLTVAGLILSQQAFGMGGAAKDPENKPAAVGNENKVQSADGVPRVDSVELKNIFQNATNSLAEIENLIQQKKLGEARTKSRAMLLDIRTRSGIEPKTPQAIDLPISIFNQHNSFADLDTNTKIKISQIVKQQSSGYFLDLLNLTKRIVLLYLHSTYLQAKEKGNIAARDLSYIKSELLSVHSIPLYLRPQNSESLYLVFDSEVADPTTQFEFNRELLDLALAIKELNFSEERFEQELEKQKLEKFKNHVAKNPATDETLGLKSNMFYVPSITKHDDGTSTLNNLILKESAPSGRDQYINVLTASKKFQGILFLDAVCRAHGFKKMKSYRTWTGDVVAVNITSVQPSLTYDRQLYATIINYITCESKN